MKNSINDLIVNKRLNLKRRNRVRKFFLITLIAIMSVALFASGAEEVKDDGVVHLTYWLDGSIESFAPTVMLTEKWNEEHPDIQVELVPLPAGDSYNQKVLTAAAGNALPDIIRMDELFVPQFAAEGVLADVTDLATGEENPINFDDIYQNALDMGIFDGKYYGYPDDYSWAVLAYRKDMFEAAGLDPENPPETWSEFVEYAEALTDAEKGQYGFVIQPYDWWFFTWMWMNGGDVFNDDLTQCTINKKEAVDALQFYVDLHSKYHVVPPAVVSAMRTQGAQFSAESAMINGQVAMLQIGPWFTQTYYQQSPEGVDNLMYAPLPVNDEKQIEASAIGGRVISISATTPYREEAWAYVVWLEENKVAYYQELAKTMDSEEFLRNVNLTEILPRKSTADLPIFSHPHLKIFVDTADSTHLRQRFTSWTKPARVINEELQAAILGMKTPQEAMDAAAAAINEDM